MSITEICGFPAVIRHVLPSTTPLQPHPVALLFPAMSDEDKAVLRNSLVEYGFNPASPIIVDTASNMIVDGVNRWTLESQLERGQPVPVAFVSFPTETSIRRFAFAQNLGRRHITREQRDWLLNALVADGLAAEELATLFGLSSPTIYRITAATRKRIADDRDTKIVELTEQGMTQAQVAAEVGVRQSNISRNMQNSHNEKNAYSTYEPTTPDRRVPEPKLKEMVGGRVAGIDIKTKPDEWLKFQEVAHEENKTPTTLINEIISHVANSGEVEIDKFRSELPQTVEAKVERIIRKLEGDHDRRIRQLEADYKERIKEASDAWLNQHVLPNYHEKAKHFDAVIKNRKGLLTKAQYRKILRCVHPDSIQDEERKPLYAEVFDLFRSLEIVLLDEKELPIVTSTLPKTVAEMMEMKAAVKQARATRHH